MQTIQFIGPIDKRCHRCFVKLANLRLRRVFFLSCLSNFFSFSLACFCIEFRHLLCLIFIGHNVRCKIHIELICSFFLYSIRFTGPYKHQRRCIPATATTAKFISAIVPIELPDQRSQNGLLEGQLTDANRQHYIATAAIDTRTPPTPPDTVLALCRMAGGIDFGMLFSWKRHLPAALRERATRQSVGRTK